MKIAIEKLQIN